MHCVPTCVPYRYRPLSFRSRNSSKPKMMVNTVAFYIYINGIFTKPHYVKHAESNNSNSIARQRDTDLQGMQLSSISMYLSVE